MARNSKNKKIARKNKKLRYRKGGPARLDMRKGGRVSKQVGGINLKNLDQFKKEPGETEADYRNRLGMTGLAGSLANPPDVPPSPPSDVPPPPSDLPPPPSITRGREREVGWWTAYGYATMGEALRSGKFEYDQENGVWILKGSDVPPPPPPPPPPPDDDGITYNIGDQHPDTGLILTEDNTWVRPEGVGDDWNWTDGQWIEPPREYTQDPRRWEAAAQDVISGAAGEGAKEKAVIKAPMKAGYVLTPDGTDYVRYPEGHEKAGELIPAVKDITAKELTTDALADELDATTAGGFRMNVAGDDYERYPAGHAKAGQPIPVIEPEGVTTATATTDVIAPDDITAGKYTAEQIAAAPIIDPATGELSPESKANVEAQSLTMAAEGVTISEEEAASRLTDRVIGTLDPEAKATAAKIAGTTLPRVLRAKKQLRKAGLSEEDINDFANDPDLLEEKLMEYTEVERGIIEGLPNEALVNVQLESLLSGMESGEIPNFAKPAVAAVNQLLAQRGLDASTVGRDALFNAIISAATPLAQSNAQTIKESVLQQRSIEAQASQIDAQMAQQTALSNADKTFNLNMAQFTADQQTALSNSKFLQTVTFTNASNLQQAAMQTAASWAQLDVANLGTRERVAVNNAKSFLNMDLANLSNVQQSRIVNGQMDQQRMLSNQAAQNASLQFNAQSQQQVDTFMANLGAQIDLQNASRKDAMAQFNANSKNAAEARRVGIEADISKANAAMINDIAKYNSQRDFERVKWNTANAQAIEMSNVDWRRKLNLADTAAQNQVNMQNAMNAFDLEKTSMAMMWQELRDKADYEFKAAENEATRKTQLLATALGNDGAGAAENWSGTVGTLINSVLSASYGATTVSTDS
tara:strand:+ start:101 stop:2704 length:2604 start_codon:yes stop_codon:yes gene_type:complete